MDSITPQNPQSEIQKAISQIKEWQKAGKKEDALQGCKEILEADPGNIEVKTIMEDLQKPVQSPVTTPTPQVQPATPTPIVLPKTEPTFDITAPDNPLYSALNKTTKTEEEKKKPIVKKETSHGILLNISIVVITLLVLGGSGYAYLKFFAPGKDIETIDLPKEDTIVTTNDSTDTGTETTDTTTDETKSEATIRNEQRFSDLTEMESIIKNYYDVNGKYPDAMEFAGFVSSYDPLDGQTDTSGQVFAYSYAVYNTNTGTNQEYILSALFEDEVNGNTIWTTGADPQDHPDYRDGTASNFIMITAQGNPTSSTTTTTEETSVKVKVKK